MPELPEVETIARGLAKRVIGDVIESVWLGKETSDDMLKKAGTTFAEEKGKGLVQEFPKPAM